MKLLIKQFFKQLKSEVGFTLVEIIVATTVFVTATMLFMGVFSTISNNTLIIENTRLAQQDARYAIEQISREVRNGWNYDVDTTGEILSYQTCEDGTIVDHELQLVKDSDDQGRIVKVTGLMEEDITSSLSDVNSFSFAIDQPAGMYPLVEIHMNVKRSEFDRFANELEFTTKVGSRVREKVESCGL